MLIHEEPRDILISLLRQYGNGLVADSKRCQALLRDRCGAAYRREIVCLSAIVQLQLISEIPNNGQARLMVRRLAGKLEELSGLDRDLAEWGIETWGVALGRIAEAEISKSFECPISTCKNSGIASRNWVGRSVVCPRCKTTFDVSEDLTLNATKTPPANLAAGKFTRWTVLDRSPTSGIELRERIERVIDDPALSDQDKLEILGFRRAIAVFEDAALQVLSEAQLRRSPPWKVRDIAAGAISGVGNQPGLRLQCDSLLRRRIVDLMPSFPADENILAVIESMFTSTPESAVVFGDRSFFFATKSSVSKSFEIPYGEFPSLMFERRDLRTIAVEPRNWLIPLENTGVSKAVLLQILNTIKHTLTHLPTQSSPAAPVAAGG